MLDPPVAPSALLLAAAEIRAQEHGGRARVQIEKLAKLLQQVQAADQRVEERLKSEIKERRRRRRQRLG
jgi:hypothetical protein